MSEGWSLPFKAAVMENKKTYSGMFLMYLYINVPILYVFVFQPHVISEETTSISFLQLLVSL